MMLTLMADGSVIPTPVGLESHSCSWDAPDCQACIGGKVVVDGFAMPAPCPGCGGTSVDARVPLRLVDIGSVLRAWQDGTTHIVIARAGTNIATRSIKDGRWSTRVERLVGPDQAWQLVHAVPRMREGVMNRGV
jgi:hypothetical protein